MIRNMTIQIENVIDDIRSTAVLQAVALTAITLLALTMRLFRLGEWSFWIDEAYTVRYVQDFLAHPSLVTAPSLALTGLFIQFLGVSDWTARLAGLLIGVVSIPLLYVPFRRMFGASSALLASFLIAISAWHLHWSQNARFYTALMLFYALAQFAFYFWLETNRFRYLVLSGVFLILAALERMIALFIVPAIGLYLVVLAVGPRFKLNFGRPSGLTWRNMVILVLPALALGIYRILILGYVGDFTENIVGYQHNPVRVFLSIVYDVGLPVFMLALVGGLYLLRLRSRAGLFLLLNAIVPVALLVVISPYVQSFSRYVFVTFPSWALLGAVAVKELYVHTPRITRVLALGVIALLLVDGFSQDVLYFNYQNGNRPDWKGAFQMVEDYRQPGDQVATTRTVLAEYYLGEEALWTKDLDPSDIVDSKQRTWFVIDNRTAFVSSKLQNFLSRYTRLIGIKDVSIPGKTMEMRVYLYDPAYNFGQP